MSEATLLPEELTIYTVGEWYPRCAGWAAADEPDALRVDASPVRDVDAAGVQLLLSLANALAARGRTLRLEQPSAPLASACGVLGVGHLLAVATAETAP